MQPGGWIMSKRKGVSLAPVPSLTLGENDPTPERLMRAGVSVSMSLNGRQLQVSGPEAIRAIGADGVFRLSEAPLDRLASRRRLDESDARRNAILYEAGQRLRRHHYVGGLSGIAANDLERSGSGKRQAAVPFSQAQAEARDALRAARDALSWHDWTAVYGIVCEERSLEAVGQQLGYRHTHAANAVALDRLRRGLEGLAEFWGTVPPRVAAEAA